MMNKKSPRLAPVGVICLIAFGFFSCRLSREYPPQPVRIVGMSYIPDAALQLVPPLNAEAGWPLVDSTFLGSIMASGDGRVPSVALDPLQGKLIAKQMAKQAARRRLAEKVEAKQVRPGVTVGSIISKDAEKRSRLEDFIRTARQQGEIKAEGGTCTVFLRLNLTPLHRILSGTTPAASGSSSAVATLSEETIRRRSRDEAVENARDRLLDYLKSLRLPEGDTLGDLMLRDDKIDSAIRQRIRLLQPAVAFKKDNTCEAAIIMDLADVQRILDQRRRRFGILWPRSPDFFRKFKRKTPWRPSTTR